MGFSDQAFKAESLLFPTREDVQEYLIRYSQDVRHLISFSTQVQNISYEDNNGFDAWKVTSKSTITSQERTTTYDAVIVANGHYSVPFIPAVPGIEEFNTAYPSVISHSKIFRSPDSFANKKVIVVGNAASGLDIGTQISKVCRKPLLNSVRQSSGADPGEDKEEVPVISEYMVDVRGVNVDEMHSWERERVKEYGDGTSFHVLGYPKDAEYLNELHDWAKSAQGGFSKEPAYWDAEQKWVRSIYSEIRKKFHEDGEKAKTLKELGFEYEKRAD
ncbi:Thiol-specific monooxygenase protein [Rutstroemia sp. NJR-2017a BBW]|nr:Thiol-specific monooxygenase protein [Rutstroemia sp. NJR-2017a BBW]